MEPLPSEIVQCYRFNTRVRQLHESVSTYLAQLNQLAEYCNYKDTLKQMLREWDRATAVAKALTRKEGLRRHACNNFYPWKLPKSGRKTLVVTLSNKSTNTAVMARQATPGNRPPHTTRQPPQADRKPTTVRCQVPTKLQTVHTTMQSVTFATRNVILKLSVLQSRKAVRTT